MSAFVAEHPWGVALALTALLFLAERLIQLGRSHPTQASGRLPGKARSFASVRALTPEDLREHCGTYSKSARDLMGDSVLVVLFTVVGATVALSLWPSPLGLGLTSGSVLCCGAVVVMADARATRVITQDRISYESPVPAFSWSVAMSDVIQCDLVPGKPNARLRVHTTSGSYTLPLTAELWQRLAEVYVGQGG